MRSIVIAAVMAAGLGLAGTAPLGAAPANQSAVSQAAQTQSPVHEAFCRVWRRCFHGFYSGRRCNVTRRCW